MEINSKIKQKPLLRGRLKAQNASYIYIIYTIHRL